MDGAATSAPLFPLDQKFDFSALLKSAASTMAALQASTSLSTGTCTVSSTPSSNGTSTQVPIPASQLPPFQAMRPIYAPSGYGRQILIYDSRSYPGHRREFAYKTRFTNQSGLTTVYYRCMACRALRHRLQRILPKEKLPAVPCIAVKNDLLINDPDYPEASDHFCTPLTVQESMHRLKVTFERGFKRTRMKMAAEEKANASKEVRATATCEITEQPLNLDQYFWIKNETSPDSNTDDAAHSTSSTDDSSEKTENFQGLLFDQRSTVTNETTSNSDVDMEEEQPQTSKSKLDTLLRLQDERENSISPNENVFPPNSPVTASPPNPNPSGLPNLSAFPFFNPFMQNNPDLSSLMNLQSLVQNLSSLKNSEAMPRISRQMRKPRSGVPGAHVNEIINKYIKSSWDLPENCTFKKT